MTYHIRKHHPQISVPVNHTRGRKPLTRADEFERSKYSMFFQSSKRKAKNDEIMNIENVVENVFNSIFKGKYSNKLFSHPKNYEEHYILNKLANKTIFDVGKNNNVITCDTVFLEYLFIKINFCLLRNGKNIRIKICHKIYLIFVMNFMDHF